MRPCLQRNSDKLLSQAKGLLSRMKAERINAPVGVPSRVKGSHDSIDLNKPPLNHRDAMQRDDHQEGAEAYDTEYQGFIEPGFKVLS